MKKIIAIVLCCLTLIATSSCALIDADSKKVAPIITEFEKKRAEEIASFKEKKPGYIVEADNRAGYVEYILLLDSTNDKAAENFVKKHDLKKEFPKAEIDAGYGVVTLKFERDDYTNAVHNALKKLSKKSSVEIGEAHVYAGSSIKYKPDISRHAENPTELEFENLSDDENNILPKLNTSNDENLDINRILTTKADYDAYVNLLVPSHPSEASPEILEIFESIKDQYDDEFFESNALLVTKQITRSNLGYGLSVDNVYLSDNKIYVVVRTSKSEGSAPQMLLEKTFYLTVSKDAIKGATELITLD